MSALRSGLLLWLALLATPASAHPLAPALLHLQESSPGYYDVLWRTSVTRAQQLDVTPQFPADCVSLQAPQISTEGGDAVVARWRMQCNAAGLTGRRISVQGLAQGGINVIVHIVGRDGHVVQSLLGPDQDSTTVTTAATPRQVFIDYLQLGIGHLLSGFDHLLFVAALLLLVRRLRPLLLTVTAFTLGHSLTLALASLGVIRVPQSWAELGIALSLLVLAVELAKPSAAPPCALARRPWLMAAAFGLLHGLGFAGALADVGLPQGEIPLALFAFNVGIELGQLVWISALLAAVWAWCKLARNGVEIGIRALPVYLIGSLAAYWFWHRLAVVVALT